MSRPAREAAQKELAAKDAVHVSRPSWRRWWVAGALLGALVLAFVFALGEGRRGQYATLRQYEAMCTIGRAALEYLREKDEAPRRVNDLVEAGFLHLDESEHTMMSSPPGGRNTVFADEAYQIRLSFPEKAKGYQMVNDDVTSRSDHGPVVLVSCDRGSTELQDYANRLLAEEWYAIMETIEGD